MPKAVSLFLGCGGSDAGGIAAAVRGGGAGVAQRLGLTRAALNAPPW